MKNKVTVEVQCQTGDGSTGSEYMKLKICSHWNYDYLVHIYIDKEQYTLHASDLIDAIKRCSR